MQPRGVTEAQIYSFSNLGTKWGSVVNATPRTLYPGEGDPVPIVQEDGWGREPVWTGVENLDPTEI